MRWKFSLIVFGLMLIVFLIESVSAGKTLYMTADNAIVGKNVVFLDEYTQSWIHNHDTLLTGNPSVGYYLYYPKKSRAVTTTPDGDNHIPPLSSDDNYWISKNSYTGSFSAGIWKFFVKLRDRGGGQENGQFHINLFKCSSQTDTSTCTYLLDATSRIIVPGDSGTMIQFNSGSASSISLNNQYLLIQLYDYITRTSEYPFPEISLEYTSDISRIESPDFGVSGCISDCTGKECGNDGCGGSCGGCVADEECRTGGVCFPRGHSCLSSDDIIIKLFSQKNSHGALWNYPNYNWDICCEDIFGAGSPECSSTEPHTSTCVSPVLWLYQQSNSHASTKNANGYTIPVCYGDLSCRAVIDPTTCATDEKVVVRLNADTNAHISDASDLNYKIKICCKSVSVKEAYWANMKDVRIADANLNDLVKLVVSGEGFVGKQIEYQIYKDVALWFDSKVASISSTGFTTWRAGKNKEGVLTEGTYYFKAKAVDVVGEWVKSGEDLKVNPEQNTPPSVNIISPENRQIYFKDENLNFKAEIFDEDDSFTYEWDLGDGTKKSDSREFTHAYTSTGQKNIVLKATDDRGATSIARISILIVDYDVSGKYAFAYIDAPEFLKGYKSPVDFNGGSSYAVEVKTPAPPTQKTIGCIAGKCPPKTEGCPGANPDYETCKITLNPQATNPAVYNNILFLWEFSKDNWQTKLTSNPADGIGKSALFDFKRIFTQIGKYYTKLNVSLATSETFEPGIFDSEFFVGTTTTAGECSEDGSEWILGDTTYISTLIEGVCGSYDEDCCPEGRSCQTPEPKTCLLLPEFCDDIFTCANYSDLDYLTVVQRETKCKDDDCNVGGEGGLEWEASQEGVSKCGTEGVSCGCKWDGTDSKCYFSKRVDTTTDPKNPEKSHECVTTTTKTAETDDYYTLKLTTEKVIKYLDLQSTEETDPYKIANDYPDCPNETTTIRKSVKLVFFTLASLIMAVAVIIIIYFIKIKREVINKKRKDFNY